MARGPRARAQRRRAGRRPGRAGPRLFIHGCRMNGLPAIEPGTDAGPAGTAPETGAGPPGTGPEGTGLPGTGPAADGRVTAAEPDTDAGRAATARARAMAARLAAGW